MPSKFVVYEGTEIHYTIDGKGLPVMLLHGFAESHHIWQQQKEILKDRFMVITPDIPGTGKSTALIHSSVTMDDYAQAIKKIVAAEKIDRLVMIGHSMGGYITLAYHDLFPADLLAMGLFHSTAYADNPDKKVLRKKSIDFIETNGSHLFLQTSLPGLFYQPKQHHPSIESILKMAEHINPSILIQYYQAMMERPDRNHLLRNADIPILFIAGQHDHATPCLHAVQQSTLPYLSEIHILKASAHMGMLEEPTTSNHILSKFLERLEGRSGQAFQF